MDLSDLEPQWPASLVPAEFVLNSMRLASSQLPIRPVFFEGTAPYWVQGYHSAYDWDWTRLPVFARYSWTEKAYRDLGSHWKATSTKVWMTLVEPWSDPAEIDWILLDGEVAALIAGDFRGTNFSLYRDDALIMITEDGQTIASQGGAWSREELLLSHQVLPNGKEFLWPDWVTLIMSRHRDENWGNDLANAFMDSNLEEGFSFYGFCMKSWRDYVFDQLQLGTDKAVEHVLKTMQMLDDMGYGSSCQAITVWDDLAMVYYADNPPDWILRLWKFMNPLELWIDMTTREGMEALRQKAARRDSRYMKR
jgi:hypothetical protein